MLYVKLLPVVKASFEPCDETVHPVVSAPISVAKTVKVSLPAATSVAVEASSADMELSQTPMSVCGGKFSPKASVSSCVCVKDHGASAACGGGGVEGISVPGAVSTSVVEGEDLLENQLLISESD